MIEGVYNITGHVYRDKINVVFTDNVNKSIKNKCKELKIKPGKYLFDKDEVSAQVCNVDEKHYGGLWVIFDTRYINDGTIVHECMHLCHLLLHKRALALNPATQEAYCYLMQWLFEEVKYLQADFNKKNKKKKVV